jgi:TolB protein
VYVIVAGAPVRSAEAAAYFVAWVDRLIAGARSDTSWNTEAEKQSVISMLQEARKNYAAMAK